MAVCDQDILNQSYFARKLTYISFPWLVFCVDGKVYEDIPFRLISNHLRDSTGQPSELVTPVNESTLRNRVAAQVSTKPNFDRMKTSQTDGLERIASAPQSEQATVIQQILLASLDGSVRVPVASFAVNGITGPVQLVLIQAVVSTVHQLCARIQRSQQAAQEPIVQELLHPLAFVSDGSTFTGAAIRTGSVRIHDKKESQLFCLGHDSFYMSMFLAAIRDPWHLIKRLRNSFHNSNPHNPSSKILMRGNERASWQTVVSTYTLAKNLPVHSGATCPLTADSVYLTSRSKMSVPLLKRFTDPEMQKWNVSWNKTEKDLWLACYNIQRTCRSKLDLATADDNDIDLLLQPLKHSVEILEGWGKNGPPVQILRDCQLMIAGYKFIINVCRGAPNFIEHALLKRPICLANFNSDYLECLFSVIRGFGGYNTAISVSAYQQRLSVSASILPSSPHKRHKTNIERVELATAMNIHSPYAPPKVGTDEQLEQFVTEHNLTLPQDFNSDTLPSTVSIPTDPNRRRYEFRQLAPLEISSSRSLQHKISFFVPIPSSNPEKFKFKFFDASASRPVAENWPPSLKISSLFDFQKYVIDRASNAKKFRDLMVISGTGSGKSICFIAPILNDKKGATIVVCPILALIHELWSRFQELKVKSFKYCSDGPPSIPVNSALNIGETQTVVLIMTPESVESNATVIAESRTMLNRIVIDEAHTMNTWKFRKSIAEFGVTMENLRKRTACVMALTATADFPSIFRLISTLHMNHKLRIIRSSIIRRNIAIDVCKVADPSISVMSKLHNDVGQELSTQRKSLNNPELTREQMRYWPRSLVYCALPKAVSQLQLEMMRHGLHALPYHGNMQPSYLKAVRDTFLQGGCPILVATSSFGMGVNVPHVSSITFDGLPLSHIEFIQQLGRAGRCGGKAQAKLFFSPSELAFRLNMLRLNQSPQSDLLRMFELAISPFCSWYTIGAMLGEVPTPLDINGHLHLWKCGTCGNCLRRDVKLFIEDISDSVSKLLVFLEQFSQKWAVSTLSEHVSSKHILLDTSPIQAERIIYYCIAHGLIQVVDESFVSLTVKPLSSRPQVSNVVMCYWDDPKIKHGGRSEFTSIDASTHTKRFLCRSRSQLSNFTRVYDQWLTKAPPQDRDSYRISDLELRAIILQRPSCPSQILELLGWKYAFVPADVKSDLLLPLVNLSQTSGHPVHSRLLPGPVWLALASQCVDSDFQVESTDTPHHLPLPFMPTVELEFDMFGIPNPATMSTTDLFKPMEIHLQLSADTLQANTRKVFEKLKSWQGKPKKHRDIMLPITMLLEFRRADVSVKKKKKKKRGRSEILEVPDMPLDEQNPSPKRPELLIRLNCAAIDAEVQLTQKKITEEIQRHIKNFRTKAVSKKEKLSNQIHNAICRWTLIGTRILDTNKARCFSFSDPHKMFQWTLRSSYPLYWILRQCFEHIRKKTATRKLSREEILLLHNMMSDLLVSQYLKMTFKQELGMSHHVAMRANVLDHTYSKHV